MRNIFKILSRVVDFTGDVLVVATKAITNPDTVREINELMEETRDYFLRSPLPLSMARAATESVRLSIEWRKMKKMVKGTLTNKNVARDLS